MSLDLFQEKGVPLDKQIISWNELAGVPYSKLNDDAFTRVRVILMNGIEQEAVRFSHAAARLDRTKRLIEPLARVRRIDHHQQTVVNWLNPPDQSPLETTIGYEQTAIEITAVVAQQEPDPYLAQAYRFGMLEDFDHLYRFTALMDRLQGTDANTLVQSYTDIRPGRPTIVEHRAPADDIRNSYDSKVAAPITKLNALTILSAENQVRDYYMNIGPMFSDPVARMLYGEIASIEEQHVTHYETLIDPSESLIEKWLLHEATEVYNYWSCLQQEPNQRLKALWERFLAYELGQLHFVMEIFRQEEGRDPEEVLPATLPAALKHTAQRSFIRKVLSTEVDLRASGPQFVSIADETPASLAYRANVNDGLSPSEVVAEGYCWVPGTELSPRAASLAAGKAGVQ